MGLDLFNSKAKKEAQRELEQIVQQHGYEAEHMKDAFVELQSERDRLAAVLKRIEAVINGIKNTPESFNKNVQTLSINLERYSKLLAEAQKESARIERGAGAGVATGVAVGGTVAAFGGTALTAMAMSVGTAGTGAAISGLSGVAATNAALAWLGGGTLAAGGAGVAGGEALLALTGPIGWGIGGAVALGTGLWARGKNAHAASEMYEQARQVKAGIKSVKAITVEVKVHRRLVEESRIDLTYRAGSAESLPHDFDVFTPEQVERAGALVNNALIGEKLLNAKLGEDGKMVNGDTDVPVGRMGVIVNMNGDNGVITDGQNQYNFRTFNVFGDVSPETKVSFTGVVSSHGANYATEIRPVE